MFALFRINSIFLIFHSFSLFYFRIFPLVWDSWQLLIVLLPSEPHPQTIFSAIFFCYWSLLTFNLKTIFYTFPMSFDIVCQFYGLKMKADIIARRDWCDAAVWRLRFRSWIRFPYFANPLFVLAGLRPPEPPISRPSASLKMDLLKYCNMLIDPQI